MSVGGNCHNCGKEYPIRQPKFCVRCGTNLEIPKEVKQEGVRLYPEQVNQRIYQERRQVAAPHHIMRKREFKLFTNEVGLVGLFIVLLMTSQSELLLWGFIGMIVILALRTNGTPVPFVKDEKSSIAIWAGIAGVMFTFPLVGESFFYWLANIFVFSVVHYFTPPKEVITKYSVERPSIILGFAELTFIIFMYLELQFIGLFFSTLMAVTFISNTHSEINKGVIKKGIQQPTPTIRSVPSRINYQIMSGVDPIINTEGTMPDLRNQLNDILRKLERQVETFEIGLERLDNQYQELKEIVYVKLPVEIDTIEENIQKNAVNSRELYRFNRSFDNIKSQVYQFEEERKKLIINYHDKYERIVIAQLEEILVKAKDNYSKITERVDLSQEYTINEELSKLDQLESKLDLLQQHLVEHELKTKLEIQDKRKQQQQEIMARQELRSFKLQEIISEKVISNLFAYLGAAFIVAGFFYLLDFTYNNFILERFPDTASFSDAKLGITLLYLFSIFLMTVPGFILNKFGIKFDLLFPILISAGIVFLQLTLYVQSFYFLELDAENSSFAIIGSIIIIGGFLISYRWKSQLVGIFATEFAIWVFYISSVNELVTEHFVTFGFGLILIVSVLLVYYRQLWIPLAIFSLFTPVLWLFLYRENNNIWLPEYLALGISVANIGLVLLKKMPTSKPFSNFLATLFLIYPNIIALQFTVILPTDDHLESVHGTSSILIVLTAFFLLYWIYVLIEKEIVFDLSIPVSYKFREEQIKYQSIKQKLNWLMLSSLVILLIAGFELYNREIYFPLIFFAVFLAFMSNVALIKDFEKLVKSSSILFIFVSQLFYVLNLYNPETPTIAVALLSGIFLISFTLNFQFIAKYQNEFNLSSLKLDPYQMGVLVAVLSTINYIIASLSDFESAVLFIAVFQWLIIIHTSLLNPNKSQIHRKLLHIAALAAPLTLFIAALLKQTSNFKYDTMFDQIIVNSPLILILGYVFFVTFHSELLIIEKIEPVRLTNTWDQTFISSHKIYVPQILLFIFPNILILYSKPYFVDTTNNQIILALYFIIYFLALPILFKISDRKPEKSFSILSSLMGYFSFLFAFIFLGGAKIVYDKIINSDTRFRKDTFIPLEWAIFLFVLIFVLSISWTFSLSKKFENLKSGVIVEEIKSKSEGTL